MALVYQQLFTGTSGTVVSDGGTDYTPDLGARFPRDVSGAGTTLNGSGVAVLASGGLAHHYSPVAASNDGTLFFSMRNNTGSTQNGINVFVRGGTSLFSAMYALNVDWFGNGLRLISTADGTVASYNPGLSAATFITGRLVIQGFRIRVWVGSNVGTPDIDWTDPNSRYSTGRVGWWADSSGADIDLFEWDDAVLVPGGGGLPDAGATIASVGAGSGGAQSAGRAATTIPSVATGSAGVAVFPPLASPPSVRRRTLDNHPLNTLPLDGAGSVAPPSLTVGATVASVATGSAGAVSSGQGTAITSGVGVGPSTAFGSPRAVATIASAGTGSAGVSLAATLDVAATIAATSTGAAAATGSGRAATTISASGAGSAGVALAAVLTVGATTASLGTGSAGVTTSGRASATTTSTAPDAADAISSGRIAATIAAVGTGSAGASLAVVLTVGMTSASVGGFDATAMTSGAAAVVSGATSTGSMGVRVALIAAATIPSAASGSANAAIALRVGATIAGTATGSAGVQVVTVIPIDGRPPIWTRRAMRAVTLDRQVTHAVQADRRVVTAVLSDHTLPRLP